MRTLPSIAAAVALAALAAPHAVAAQPGPVAHFSGGVWFNGETFQRADWYVVEGRLTRTRPKRVDVRVDLRGRHVIPPFAEAHNHDMQHGPYGARTAARYLRAGIFYGVQMCSQPEEVAAFAGFLTQPATVDVVFTAACVSASDGHPLGIAMRSYEAEGNPVDPDELRDHIYLSVDTLADLEAKWPRISQAPSRLLKILFVNSEDYAANRLRPELFGFNGLDPALAPEIVRRAHAEGIRVAAHADTAHDFRVAVEAGADIIAHLPGYRFTSDKSAEDYRIPDDVVAEAARRGVTVITTAAVSQFFAQRRPDLADAQRATQLDNIRRLTAAGVKLAAGSDLAGIGGDVLDEIEHLDKLQVMPRSRLLRIATDDTARMIFPDRRIGRLDEGYEANFIVLEGDPIDDLGAIRKVWLRVKQGNVLPLTPEVAPASVSDAGGSSE